MTILFHDLLSSSKFHEDLSIRMLVLDRSCSFEILLEFFPHGDCGFEFGQRELFIFVPRESVRHCHNILNLEEVSLSLTIKCIQGVTHVSAIEFLSSQAFELNLSNLSLYLS